MKKLYNWCKSKLNKLLINLYSKTWLLALTWTLVMITLTLLWEYNKCVRCANAITWITNLGLLNLLIFFLTVGILTIFTLSQIFTIHKNKKNGAQGEEELLKDIDILEAVKSSHPSIIEAGSKIIILPWYMIGIYSISRIIIFSVMKYNGEESITLDIDFQWIWFILFTISWTIWFYLKRYANKDTIFSVGYTIFVIFVTWLTLYWETLIPYILDISQIFQCITETYVIDNNLSIDNNISKCVQP